MPEAESSDLPESLSGPPVDPHRGGEGTTWETLISESVSFPTGILRALGRATMDPAFRDALFENPDSALSDLVLSQEEREQLAGLRREQFDSVIAGMRMELTGVLAQAIERDRRILEFAKAWEADIDKIMIDDDEEPSGAEGEEMLDG